MTTLTDVESKITKQFINNCILEGLTPEAGAQLAAKILISTVGLGDCESVFEFENGKVTVEC